jgi:hypothetical protein
MTMKRIYRSKYSLIVAVFLLVLMSGGKCYANRIIAEWEPFKTKAELELRAVSVPPTGENVLPRDEFYKTESAMRIEPYPTDKKNSSVLDILKYHNISISFSRIIVQQTQIDAQKSSGEGSNKLNEFKSLPPTFFTSPYKDTFESMGRIFEPQVNLRIEF